MHSEGRINAISLALVFMLVANCCGLWAQGINDHPKMSKKVGLGIFNHSDGRLVTGSFEFCLAKRITVEPSIGFTVWRSRKLPFGPLGEIGTQYRYAAGIELKYYFLFNRRFSQEGIFVDLLGSYYRSHAYYDKSDYVFFRSFHSKFGFGVGGNYYLYRRFSIGGAAWLSYINGTDQFFRPSGSLRSFYRKDGFVLPYILRASVTF